MKKIFRLTALALALMMCFGVTASATGITETEKATIKDPLTGAIVTFTDNAGEKIEVTYESSSIKEGQFYLVMVVMGTKDEDTDETIYVPTTDTILYINQTTGQAGSAAGTGKIVFGENTDNVIYPSDIKDSAILIYGANINGDASSLIAAIIDAKYIIGDVDKSGEVDVGDATMLLRYLAGLVEDISTVDLDAADTDSSSIVDVGDATKLLRVLAGLTEF